MAAVSSNIIIIFHGHHRYLSSLPHPDGVVVVVPGRQVHDGLLDWFIEIGAKQKRAHERARERRSERERESEIEFDVWNRTPRTGSKIRFHTLTSIIVLIGINQATKEEGVPVSG